MQSGRQWEIIDNGKDRQRGNDSQWGIKKTMEMIDNWE